MTENIVQHKRCSLCGEEKPLDEFYRHKHRQSVGRSSRCKPCCRANVKKHTDRLRQQGRCLRCGAPQSAGHLYCAECRALSHIYDILKRQSRKEKGQCLNCTDDVLPGTLRCAAHAKRMATYNRKRERNFKEMGLCARCGKLRIEHSATCCRDCYVKTMAHGSLGSRKPWKLLLAKLEEQHYKCAYSGQPLILGLNATVDHILPVSKFPERRSDPSNIQWVTSAVNQMKHAMAPTEFLTLVKQIAEFSLHHFT